MTARALAAAVVLLAGCVHYPSVADVGGARIRPDKGRAVRENDGYAVYLELASTGKFGDTLVGATSPVAREAKLVTGSGHPTSAVEIPGATTVTFAPGGPHVVLRNLTRALTPGETIIVTLLFEKSGGIGVVTRVE